MNVEAYIEHLKNSPSFMKNVTEWRVLPPREAKYADFPDGLDARLVEALARRGVKRPYSHQRLAIDAALAGEDLVVVTPTASGKTLCYNVPVLNAILQNEANRALYLFPTKALSSDQTAEPVSYTHLDVYKRQVRSLSGVGVGYLRGAVLSTRGPGWTGRWCTCCTAKCIAG